MTEIQQIDYQFQNKCDNLMKLLPKIQCHNCEGVPGPRPADGNRYVCRNSHHLCENCKYEKCPCGSSTGGWQAVLGRSFGTGLTGYSSGYRNPAPSTMIPLLFDVFGLPWPCQNYPRGCRDFLIESELENHEINCVFRLVNCVDDLCIDVGPGGEQIEFHYVLEHFENNCKTTNGPSFSPAIKVEGVENSFVFLVNLAKKAGVLGTGILYLTPRKMEIQEENVSLENSSIMTRSKLTFFAVGCLNKRSYSKHYFMNGQNENCYIWVYMIGSPFEAKNYTSTISIASNDGNELYTRKGPVFTLDDDYGTVMENNSIFKIKTSFAKEFMDESSKLQGVKAQNIHFFKSIF